MCFILLLFKQFVDVYVHVCMLTSLCDIILLARHFLYVLWACILLYLSFHLLHLLYFVFIKLHRTTYLVAWPVYGFAGYLVTYLQWTGGLVGWLAGCPFGLLVMPVLSSTMCPTIGCFPSGWSDH